MIVPNIDLKIVQGSRGPDHEDMSSWVGPPPSSNHFPSARSTDFARRLSVGRQSVVWVSLCHEGSLFEDGSDVPFLKIWCVWQSSWSSWEKVSLRWKWKSDDIYGNKHPPRVMTELDRLTRVYRSKPVIPYWVYRSNWVTPRGYNGLTRSNPEGMGIFLWIRRWPGPLAPLHPLPDTMYPPEITKHQKTAIFNVFRVCKRRGTRFGLSSGLGCGYKVFPRVRLYGNHATTVPDTSYSPKITKKHRLRVFFR